MSAFQDRLDFILRVHCIFIVTSLRERLIVSTPGGEYKVRSFQISSSVEIWGLNWNNALYITILSTTILQMLLYTVHAWISDLQNQNGTHLFLVRISVSQAHPKSKQVTAITSSVLTRFASADWNQSSVMNKNRELTVCHRFTY